jgi:DNA-directed RNA polymerase subunit RPC12/RpoP
MTEIPNIKASPIREKMILFYPCMHCGYEKDHGGSKSGRCRDCAIPFAIIDHHGKGRCNRCYMKEMRKTPQVIA